MKYFCHDIKHQNLYIVTFSSISVLNPKLNPEQSDQSNLTDSKINLFIKSFFLLSFHLSSRPKCWDRLKVSNYNVFSPLLCLIQLVALLKKKQWKKKKKINKFSHLFSLKLFCNVWKNGPVASTVRLLGAKNVTGTKWQKGNDRSWNKPSCSVAKFCLQSCVMMS